MSRGVSHPGLLLATKRRRAFVVYNGMGTIEKEKKEKTRRNYGIYFF
jgi:hypothetical protein